MVIVAVFHAIILLTQLFMWDLWPLYDGPDPFATLPWFLWALGTVAVLAAATVAIARIRCATHAVTISLVGSILLLPIFPWTMTSIFWLAGGYHREKARAHAAN